MPDLDLIKQGEQEYATVRKIFERNRIGFFNSLAENQG